MRKVLGGLETVLKNMWGVLKSLETVLKICEGPWRVSKNVKNMWGVCHTLDSSCTTGRGQLVKRGLKPKAQRNPQRRAFPPPFLNMFICLI